MKPYKVIKNIDFIGRKVEINRLNAIRKSGNSSIIIIYGRRRVGKTELIEQYFQKDVILKFEGIQTNIKSKVQSNRYQINNCLHRLANYMENPLYKKIVCKTWTDFFEILDPIIHQHKVILYFDEIQWLANYRPEFLAEIKPFWDDSWRHISKFLLVFCGSSPSFIVNQLMGDKALYSRSQNEFHLKPFNAVQIKRFLKKAGNHEAMLAQLTIGGIPEYLKKVRESNSVLSGICQNSFLPDSFFFNEAQRIFVSSLSNNKHYKQIIDFLSKKKYATRKEIQSRFSIKSGGTLSTILMDLESCGFIDRYVPLNLHDNSLLSRYMISDEYLQFYYKYIYPQKSSIENRKFRKNPSFGLPTSKFQINLGFCFERWCRKNSDLFARILGFDKIEYRSGPFFNRESESRYPGFQIDLMYIRADHRILICEIKYYQQDIDLKKVFTTVLKKKDIFCQVIQKYKHYSYEFILITTEGVKNNKGQQEYFDHVICFDDIFDPKYW